MFLLLMLNLTAPWRYQASAAMRLDRLRAETTCGYETHCRMIYAAMTTMGQ